VLRFVLVSLFAYFTPVRALRKHSRPKLAAMDKLFWGALLRFWGSWKKALIVVTPDTVVRWRPAGFLRELAREIDEEDASEPEPVVRP
jgi:hypothetical protein